MERKRLRKEWVLLQVLFVLAIICHFGGTVQASTTWTTIPIHGYGMDIDGSNIVAGNQLYNIDTQNITTFYTPDDDYVNIYGIDGDNMAGYYISKTPGDQGVRGFLYDGSSWTTIHKAGSDRTSINDIEGNNLIGQADNSAFLYNLTDNSWTVINKPGASTTVVNGISGNNIVGEYYDGSDWQSFLYNMTDQIWTTLPIYEAFAIDGSYIVGGNQLYNIDTQTITTFDIPEAEWTNIYGIDGDNIVGEYYNASSGHHGFLCTIPEPVSILLFAFAGLLLRRTHQ